MMESKLVSCMFMLMLMNISQHFLLHHSETESPSTSHPSRYRYRAPIPYALFNHFTFVGMHNVLCNHLTRFTPAKIYRLLPLLGLEDIRFRNRYEATPEEAFAVVLIRLSYPIRYLSMMDRFGHSQSWLLVVFNDTDFHIYQRFKQILEWDDRRLTFTKLSEFSLAIHVKGGGHCF